MRGKCLSAALSEVTVRGVFDLQMKDAITEVALPRA
jgi:hypothetical protein